MPNWCLNNLTVSHTDKKMMDRFVDAYNKGNTCQEFIPEPESFDEGDEFGTNGWYGWRVNNWGTKWDVGYDEGKETEGRHGHEIVDWNNGKTYEVICTFDSAWSPPIGLYNKLVELGYDVHASYFEPGCAFCGIYHNGHDNCVEYQEKGEIPVAIWNDFNLGEFFEEDEPAR